MSTAVVFAPEKESIDYQQNYDVLICHKEGASLEDAIAKTGLKPTAIKNKYKDAEYLFGRFNKMRNVPRGTLDAFIMIYGKDAVVNYPTWWMAQQYIIDNGLKIKY